MTSTDPALTDRSPIADGLFSWPDPEPVLLGAQCAECDCVTFPRQESCPRCTVGAMSGISLPRAGRLWSWTVQGFPPKSPPYRAGVAFEPYGVGYVDLGPVIVESRLTEHRAERLRIGMPMETVAIAWGDHVTFAFAPLEPTR